jgi:nitrite reductase (NADH) large subunit
LLTVLALAFLGGVVFKGKSGWCTQFCPMLQVERFYGQSPLLVVRNSHCRPCVGCTKNCYDFNPTAAYLADLHDENPRLAADIRVFYAARSHQSYGEQCPVALRSDLTVRGSRHRRIYGDRSCF